MPASMFSEWPAMSLEIGVKSFVLLAVACTLNYGLRRSSAANRHWVWRCALGSLLLLPVITVLFWHCKITLQILSPVPPHQQTDSMPQTGQQTISERPTVRGSLPPIVSSSTVGAERHPNGTYLPEITIESRLTAILDDSCNRQLAGRKFRVPAVVASIVVLMAVVLFRVGMEAQTRAYGQPGGNRPISATLPLAYEASVETFSGNRTLYSQILYDRGKFREGTIYNNRPQSAPEGFMVCDGTRPEIVWGYSTSQKTAWPQPESIDRALAIAARRNGVDAVRSHFHIPAGY